MSLRDLQFLTDENIDEEVLIFLREQGLDVYDIKEERLFSLSDRAILEFAYASNRVVITQDSDFGTLVFREDLLFWGIIYLRPGHAKEFVHIQTMKTLLANNPTLEFPFIIVGENYQNLIKFRVRLL